MACILSHNAHPFTAKTSCRAFLPVVYLAAGACLFLFDQLRSAGEQLASRCDMSTGCLNLSSIKRALNMNSPIHVSPSLHSLTKTILQPRSKTAVVEKLDEAIVQVITHPYRLAFLVQSGTHTAHRYAMQTDQCRKSDRETWIAETHSTDIPAFWNGATSMSRS